MASFSLPPLQEADNLWGPPLPASTASRADDGSDTALAAAASSSLAIRDAAAAVLPDEFCDIPFAPYTKSEKIGRIADWNAGYAGGDSGSVTNVRTRAAQRGRDTAQAFGVGAGSAFAYFHGEDEASFSVVDNTKSAAAKRGGAGGLSALGRGRGRGGRGVTTTRGGAAGARGGLAQRGTAGRALPARAGAAAARVGRRPGWKDWDKPQRTREASVTVGSEWEQLEEIDFTRLGKLRLEVGEATDLSSYGTLYEYDRSYDRITSVRFEKPLQPLDRVRYNPTTSDDPILQELASKPASGDAPRTRIFLTDSILSLLMTATRSVYPWDIIVTRDASGNIFMDKRDGGAFDFVTVNENAVDPPMDASEVAEKEGPAAAAAAAAAAKADKSGQINTPGNLSLEATYINQNFAFQVVNEKKRTQLPGGPNPFYDASAESEQLASCGYRYRQFNLSTSEEDVVELVVRTEVDAVLPAASKGAAPQYITVKTLNEFDSKAQGAGGAPEWRSKLDSQRGAVIATEMKNNAAKLARFAVQSVLAGAESMKMGYISRATPRDASRHVILGTQWYKPREFAAQINVNLANGWGIVRTIADLARKAKTDEPEAKFVLAKDPNKPVVRFYSVPLTWPQDEDEEDEGEPELEDDE